MSMLTLERIEPLLARPLNAVEKPRVSAWIGAIEAFLSQRYTVAKVAEMVDYFTVSAADAIQRRLAKPNQMADSESAGPFSVRWNSASARGGWFLAPELAEMDDTAGIGGTRTYRTQAPSGVIVGNLHRPRPFVDDIEPDGWV